MQLYEALSTHVAEWREAGYQHEEFPAIAEILEWASNPDVPNFRLRKPQLRALETYWYLRLRENTPHIFDLYQSLFPKKKDLLEAFGIPEEAAAQNLGRRWIGADINKGAIQTTIKRLQGVMHEQSEKLKSKKQALPGMEVEESPEPAQLVFAVYRVNDYDLQIQHNEAFNLAVEHLGMTRTKTDAFFDGTLGKKLVKIVPFNHPVTPLDLEEVKNELKNRPQEERDIVVVGLGKEYAVGAWLDEWNKLRKQGNIPNKIEGIELRSDPKYGGFFTHEPAKAKVSFKRIKETVQITIDDFISPTILERLRQQNKDNPLFQPQVSDWRSMVDSVMIDADFDGEVFNITLADVPERKNDLVEGKYTVETKKGATVAVKVTDMLGEEVLVISK